jgi:hypothetical protein
MMKATRLLCDEDIRKAYNDENVSIYFREGGEGVFENTKEHDLETILDATCHGFEFVAVEKRSDNYLMEDDLDIEENDLDR